jgi:hypothetical protein
LLASGALVATSSYSAFSSTMSAPKANWTAGTVDLQDNGYSTWTLDVSNLKPGDRDTECTTVTSSGTLPVVWLKEGRWTHLAALAAVVGLLVGATRLDRELLGANEEEEPSAPVRAR